MAARVVITGIGVVSPIGCGIETFWSNLLENKPGVDKISLFDASSFPSQIAAEVTEFIPEKYLSKSQIKFQSRSGQFSCAAYKMASDDANLQDTDPYRTDVIMGASIPSLQVIDDQINNSETALAEYEPGKFDPLFALKFFTNGPSSAIGLMSNAKGYITTVSSACSSGLTALGTAAQRIRDGYTDVAITGAVDTPINQIVLNAFCSAKQVTTRNDDPANALCPFDAKRTRPALGEGAAVFILEEAEHALARGAKIYSEILSFYQDHENTNVLFACEKSGKSWANNIRKAVEGSDQKFNPDYISAHAPSDTLIDRIECEAIKMALGEKANKIPTSSIKGVLGSAFSAAGAFQIASSAMAIFTGIMPPSSNYKDPDIECDLKFIKKFGKKRINQVLVNSHALGSTNASLLMGKFKL